MPEIVWGLSESCNLGRLSNLTLIKNQPHFDIHCGVGHGWTAGSSDMRVFKALLGLRF
jgi:hypothetical protein